MLFDDYNPLEGKMLQILDADGNVNRSLEPQIDRERLISAYKTMLMTRTADDKAIKLQRQGRIGAYPPTKGQEASQLGPAMALSDGDWVVPGFREMAALVWRGVSLYNIYLYWGGNEIGNKYSEGVRVMPGVVPVGDQILHAVGVSFASKYRDEKNVTLTYFGDGGSSEGSFHEGLNFAGVFKTPTIFVCQNNQWAISVPRSHQTASRTIAQKAIAYGFPGILVDGNDLLALYVAATEAVNRARRGEGPTLIESYTYRLGDHTTSDDATRYRTKEELKQWEAKDPLMRMNKYLVSKGLWDEEKEKAAQEEISKLVEAESERALAVPPPAIEDVFSYTYKEMPRSLTAQLAFWKEDLGLGGAA
jgi:pyruvate dehydrogenase E1 component alpha subunit